MVLVAEKKYACEACIKGHRASVCQHSDRPLFEVKRKGRPVSQCQHCRDLRKTKQVHVRCTCALREEGDTAGTACRCDQTGECNCCTIRTPYSGRKPKVRDSKASVTPERSQSQDPTPSPADIVGAALTNGQRHLLPRPIDPQHAFVPAVSTFLSNHASGSNLQLNHNPPLHSCCSGPPAPPMPAGHASPYVALVTPQETDLTDMLTTSDPNIYTPDLSAWLTMFASPTPVEEPVPAPAPSWTVDSLSLCECGAGCGCPGCPEHGNADNSSTSCSGPDHDTCSNCLDCALVSVPLPETNQFGMQESGHLPTDLTVGGQETPSFDLQSFDVHSQPDLFLYTTAGMPDNIR